MRTLMSKSLKPWKRQKRKTSRQELTVLLDERSLECLERLKSKIKGFDEDVLVASALKCLENKTDRIIKRQVQRRVQALRNEGFNSEQIAAQLNKKNIPALGETTGWNSHAISMLLKEGAGQSAGSIGDLEIRNS